MVAAADDPNGRELSTFLVRCWSDPENDVLVKVVSYSVYQAADDARVEFPGYENYDPVRVLREALGPEAASQSGQEAVGLADIAAR